MPEFSAPGIFQKHNARHLRVRSSASNGAHLDNTYFHCGFEVLHFVTPNNMFDWLISGGVSCHLHGLDGGATLGSTRKFENPSAVLSIHGYHSDVRVIAQYVHICGDTLVKPSYQRGKDPTRIAKGRDCKGEGMFAASTLTHNSMVNGA